MFKNIYFYRLTSEVVDTPEQIAEKLEAARFKPTEKMALSSLGWVPPLGRHGDSLVHAANGCIMLCSKLEEKVVPAAVVNELAEEKIAEIEEREGRELTSKERKSVRDDVRLSLIPKAFTKSKTTFGYIDTVNKWIVVDTSSAKKADEFAALLKGSLDESISFACVGTNNSPSVVMTDWLLNDECPDYFEFTNECEMKESDGGRGVVKCKHQDIQSSEVVAHLRSGMHVTGMGLNWDSRMSFFMCDDFAVKRIKFSEMAMDKPDSSDAESVVVTFDSNFALFCLQMREFIPVLLGACGGEVG